MLEDIGNPFNQIVNRHPRPSHTAGRPSPEGVTAGRLVVPVPEPAGPAETAEPSAGHQLPDATPLVARITAEPGPGEVAPPKWWASRGASARGAGQDSTE